jgi:3-deoxy-D-manno-octulosonic-acid transferase
VYLLYSLLLTLGFVLLLPRFTLDALRQGKYITGLRQRLGNIPALNPNGRRVVWLHCVSVGEAQAAQSLVRQLKEALPNVSLVVSTTTVTGQRLARTIFREQAAAVFYFPIDWAWTVRRVLRRLNPAAILIMETELWPNLFRIARKRNIPVAVLNGRISDKSFGRYKKIRSFIARVLNDLTVAAMQSDQDASRIRELGLNDDRVVVTGNVKFDSAEGVADEKLTSTIRDRFAFGDGRRLIVAASTHDPEEAIVIEAFRKVRALHNQPRLLIAPRHPERFSEVASLLANSEFSIAVRSATPNSSDAVADIVLLDSIGELGAVYALADIAFVGGSIAEHGGHNLIEPAAHGVCTITGPHTSNFAAITTALLAEGALVQLDNANDLGAELAQAITQLLSDEERRLHIGERAQTVCESNRGATNRTLNLLIPILSAAQPSDRDTRLSTIQTVTAK